MKNRTLTLMAACLMGIAAYAQTWTAPETPTEASELVDGHKYYVRNAEAQQYLTGGSSWYSWDSSTILMGQDEALVYTISLETDDDENTAWTLVSSRGYTFISGLITTVTTEVNGLGEMHVDMAAQGHNYFDITEYDATKHLYRIQAASFDADYGQESAYADCYVGWIKDAENGYTTAVYAFLDPTVSGNCCEWELVDLTIYDARVTLYELLLQSLDYSGVDQDVINAATTVYNDADAKLEDLEEAADNVTAAIKEVAFDGATEENPSDVTIFIENNDFSTGDITGWDCTFNSTNSVNYGYQAGNTYENTDADTYINHNGVEVYPFLDAFIEAWVYSGLQYGSTSVSGSVGDAQLSQTIEDLPAGKYELSCDAMAVQQFDASANPVTGVQLFATGGDIDTYENIATGNGIPEHVVLTFFCTGGDVTLGLRTVTTTANWIGADNFELLYLGNTGSSVYMEALSLLISQCEENYPDVSDLRANGDVKNAYESTLAEAKSAVSVASSSDEEYEALRSALNEAANALATSIAEYETVQSLIDYINSLCDQANANGWDELEGDLADYRDGIRSDYEDELLTSEQIAEINETAHGMVADYISSIDLPNGTDVTILIENADFDKDFSGWTLVDGSATPNWGGMAQDVNSVENGVNQYELNSGNAEVYQNTFDMYQIIKDMPVGLYTLSCQTFVRDDGSDGNQGELYYSVQGGAEESQSIKNIYSEGSPERLYASADNTYFFNDVEVELEDGTTGWVPNGQDGANIYFSLGYYYNSFDILVTQRGDLTVGVRDTGTNDWCLFDTFRLVYQGNDANVYADYLKELMGQALALGDQGVLTVEADDMIMTAVTQAEDALEYGDGNDCIEAIEALQAAIALGEEAIELTAELKYLVDYTNEIRLLEVVSSDSSLGDLIEKVYDGLDNATIETNAKVEEYMIGLKSLYTTYVQCDHLDATETAPADITPVIMMNTCTDNSEAGSTYGWDIVSGTNVGLGSGCAEIYNQALGNGLSQVIYNLAAGYYRLGVQAFYRPGLIFTTNIDIDASEIEEADTIHYADLYAGEKATRVLSIYSDAEAYDALFSNGATLTNGNVNLTVPYSMTEANNAFENGLYNNCLQFEVAEDGTDVTIGLVKTQYIDGDWLIWDNWTLEYLGTAEPSEDRTTAIDGVEGEGTAVATAIYNVSGTQQSKLMKGINIVKTTMADGSVKVTKVLVK